MSKSKQKGNRFELAIAKLFTERFNSEFRRVPSSGALTGGSNRERNHDLGDDAKNVLSGDVFGGADFPFSIECKHYEAEPKFHHVLAGESKTLDRWLEQSDADAEYASKEPLLIFKITRVGEYVCINEETDIRLDVPHIRYKDRIIMQLTDFLDCLGSSYDHLRRV